jgi:hypothetical protein
MLQASRFIVNTHMSILIVSAQSFTLFAFSIIGINNFYCYCFYCYSHKFITVCVRLANDRSTT